VPEQCAAGVVRARLRLTMTRHSGQLAVHHRGLSKPVVQARLLLHRAVMNQLRYAVTTLSMQALRYRSPLCLPSQRQGTHEQWRGMWPTAPVVSPLREVSPRPQLHTLRHDVPSPRSIPAGGKSRQLSPGHHTPGATSRTTTASPRQLSALPRRLPQNSWLQERSQAAAPRQLALAAAVKRVTCPGGTLEVTSPGRASRGRWVSGLRRPSGRRCRRAGSRSPHGPSLRWCLATTPPQPPAHP